MKRQWITAAKIAWRESRASAGKFFFVILAVAAGVGALDAVRGFSSSFRAMLLRDARLLMAGDVSVRAFHLPDPEQEALLDRLVEQGAERTWITETASMMSSEQSSRPLMVTVKAVDPAQYPFYGEVELRPAATLQEALTPESAVATEDLLLRLGVEVGDRVKLGRSWLRIAGVLTVEPDRMTGSFNVGPRLMLSRQALAETGLIARGSRAAQRYLYKLPEQGLSVEQARQTLIEAFPDWAVADYREVNPTIRRGLDRATNFLSLVSLVAMIVGALGVAMAMHSHLQQRLDTIAIMKCVGARSAQILRIYLVQTLALGAAGSLAGLALGLAAQSWAPALIANYFPELPALEWQPWSAAQAAAVGILTTLLFSVPPLLSIRQVRPALIFRREMERLQQSPAERLRASGPSLAAGAVIVAGLAAVAGWFGDSVEMGLWFAVGLVVSLAALTATAWALLRAVKALPAVLPVKLPVALRHGLANLHRPGVHAEATLVALGVGVTFTLAVYLIQSQVIDQMARSAPPEMPNVFFTNVSNDQAAELEALLRDYPGAEGEPTMIPSVAARLESINGTPLSEMELEDRAQSMARTRTITWMGEPTEGLDVLEGEWWAADETAPYAAVKDWAAERLGIRIGDRLTWVIGADRVEAEVKAVCRVDGFRPGSSAAFILTPKTLEGRPAMYYGGVRIAPDQAYELQRDAFERFPTVMVVNAADVIEIVQEVVDQIALVVQFVSAFAILGGAVILTSSVLATRFRRVRETAILKTLGATRRRMARIFSVEFLVLGATAGLMGGLLASAFSAVLLERILEADARFDWAPALLTVVATALLANAAGWLGSFRILGQKPLEVLRGE